MARRITDACRKKLEQWEGLRLTAYQDQGGVWTIGYGHTGKVRGQPLGKGVTITKEEADQLLALDLAKFEAAVEQSVTVSLSDNQRGALVSFTFNVGVGAFKGSTLLKKLNKGDYASVPLELAKWTRVAGKPNAGLANRRAAEAGLWASGGFVASAPVQPAKPSAPPLAKSKTTLAGLGAASTTGLGLLGQVSDASDSMNTAAGQVQGIWGTVLPVLQFLGSRQGMVLILALAFVLIAVMIYRHRKYVRENPA